MQDGRGLTGMPDISVVVPVYGCAETLVPLHARLSSVLSSLVPRYELVFVDDRSTDRGWEVLQQLERADGNVRLLRLSRNYGQQIAITAGLAECRGAWAVVMDCDLQDPPELIPELWRAAQSGFEIVYASRRGGDPARRRFANRLYFSAMRKLTGYDVDPGQGAFSLISRQVIDGYLRFAERERHYLSILRWLGFTSSSILYDRHERSAGQSSYTLSALLRHAWQGFFFQTTRPLLWILWAGLLARA
jgi:dolichol-phosphate mannosyltransferase